LLITNSDFRLELILSLAPRNQFFYKNAKPVAG